MCKIENIVRLEIGGTYEGEGEGLHERKIKDLGAFGWKFLNENRNKMNIG